MDVFVNQPCFFQMGFDLNNTSPIKLKSMEKNALFLQKSKKIL